MKMQTIALTLCMLLALGLPSFKSVDLQNQMVADGQSSTGKLAFFGNPLLLNDRPLDYSLFSITSKGILTVVAGNSDITNATRIPFRVYLKRNGETVADDISKNPPIVSAIEVSHVLADAQPGDWLIIEPARQEDQEAKRVIRLTYPSIIKQFDIFAFLKKNKDGC